MATFTTLGSEFRVNSTTTGLQFNSSVAGLSGGGFVVVWTANTPTGNDILGQIYNSSGVAVGGELPIADISGVNEGVAEVAALGTGFVVAYEAPNAPLFHPNSVWTETFDSTGLGSGALEAETGSNQGHGAAVASSTAGGFLTVWDETGIGSDTDQGAVRGGVNGGTGITVNTTTAGHQSGSSVAALLDGSGNYVAAWTEDDGVGSDVMKGQFLSAAGAKVGAEFTIDGDVVGPNNQDMEIAGRPGAGFAIAFTDAGFRTHVKVFGAGNALLADFDANPVGAQSEDEAAITVLSNGLVAVAGRDFANGGFSHLRVFAPDGTQIGTEILLQAGSGSGLLADPAVAALDNGQFIVTWTDNRGTLGDADHGITAHHFTTAAASVVDGTTGDDTLNGASQTGFFMGYGGDDTVTYASAGGAVTINLANPGLNTGAAAGDEFGNSVETVAGSNFADTIVGDSRGNAFLGGGGDDTLAGGGDDDLLSGGGGSDTADYSQAAGTGVTVDLGVAGPQLISATEGSDTLSSIENVIGSAQNDTLTGNASANVINGGLGNDTMAGGGGNDVYFDNLGDTVSEALNAGYDTVNTTRSSYTLPTHVERVNYTGAGNFVGTGNTLDNRFQSGVGDDRFVDVAGGADIFSGGAGTDTLDFRTSATGATLNFITNVHSGAAAGDSYSSIEKFLGSNTAKDTMTAGGTGRFVFVGGGGNDVLTGGVKNDQLLGQVGQDTLIGGADRDSLDGGTGNDTLTGGTQGDVFVFIDAVFGQDTITDYEDGLDSFKVFSAVADDVSDFTITGNGTTSVLLTLNAAPANFITINGAAAITITVADFVFY